MARKRRIGNLVERVGFESPITVADGQGGEEEGWNPEFFELAKYTRLRGTERVIASRLEGVQPTVITVRATTGTRSANTDWRIVDTNNGETFNIRSKILSECRRYIDFTCESGVAI